jgi:hypothetical protein
VNGASALFSPPLAGPPAAERTDRRRRSLATLDLRDVINLDLRAARGALGRWRAGDADAASEVGTSNGLARGGRPSVAVALAVRRFRARHSFASCIAGCAPAMARRRDAGGAAGCAPHCGMGCAMLGPAGSRSGDSEWGTGTGAQEIKRSF